ncbi:hypothetical protein SUDANB1_05659 [Streptomyces sp. enrichment culture]|uniref:DUF1360 domain-containing protein n=1 Tax=Streptomyces sp. enrichment culture TaxID=1795815 RepID=UPI003F55F65D
MITLPVFVVLAFAAARGTQLAVYDNIADPLRDVVFAWHERKPDAKPRKWARKLITCIYCAGFWVSGIVLGVYLAATGTWGAVSPWVHACEWFALAGAQMILNRFDDFLSGDA